ncbi:MAG TPA: preprotein translocase subunit SecG [Allosphingosinicella sp.]|jgi:preprotein translocase subunit SecG
MFLFLLIVQTIVAATLVVVILMQRSEGGGLGVGGNSSGLMSARGAADFLTRATSVLGALFIILSIALAGLAAVDRAPTEIDPSLAREAPGSAPGRINTDPLSGLGGAAATTPPSSNSFVPTPEGAREQTVAPDAPANGAVPLAQ